MALSSMGHSAYLKTRVVWTERRGMGHVKYRRNQNTTEGNSVGEIREGKVAE